MTPYKDPALQRQYQTRWSGERRKDWMARQVCGLCGRRDDLRLFRHAGAPAVTWSLKGPSHRRFRVTCGDAHACLRRRAEGGRPPEPEPPPPKKKPKPRARSKLPRAANPSESRLARELREKDDVRLVCPEHGPRGTMLHAGAVRFVCCGRIAPGWKPEPKRWYEK